MIIRRAAIAAAVLVAGCAGSAPQPESKIDALMAKSGLNAQIESFPGAADASFKAVLAKPQNNVVAGDAQLIEQALQAGFKPATMKGTVHAALEKQLAAADIAATLAWLESPLGSKITALEEEASTAQGLAHMQAYAGTLKDHPPAKARIALLERLDDATGATVIGVVTANEAAMATTVGLTVRLPEAQQSKVITDTAAGLKQNAKAIAGGIWNQTLVSWLYAYQGLADAELEQYVAFAESASGKKFYAAATEGYEQAITGSFESYGAALEKSFTASATH